MLAYAHMMFKKRNTDMQFNIKLCVIRELIQLLVTKQTRYVKQIIRTSYFLSEYKLLVVYNLCYSNCIYRFCLIVCILLEMHNPSGLPLFVIIDHIQQFLFTE